MQLQMRDQLQSWHQFQNIVIKKNDMIEGAPGRTVLSEFNSPTRINRPSQLWNQEQDEGNPVCHDLSVIEEAVAKKRSFKEGSKQRNLVYNMENEATLA